MFLPPNVGPENPPDPTPSVADKELFFQVAQWLEEGLESKQAYFVLRESGLSEPLAKALLKEVLHWRKENRDRVGALIQNKCQTPKELVERTIVWEVLPFLLGLVMALKELGETDKSPGLMIIGFLLAVGSVFWHFAKRSR